MNFRIFGIFVLMASDLGSISSVEWKPMVFGVVYKPGYSTILRSIYQQSSPLISSLAITRGDSVIKYISCPDRDADVELIIPSLS